MKKKSSNSLTGRRVCGGAVQPVPPRREILRAVQAGREPPRGQVPQVRPADRLLRRPRGSPRPPRVEGETCPRRRRRRIPRQRGRGAGAVGGRARRVGDVREAQLAHSSGDDSEPIRQTRRSSLVSTTSWPERFREISPSARSARHTTRCTSCATKFWKGSKYRQVKMAREPRIPVEDEEESPIKALLEQSSEEHQESGWLSSSISLVDCIYDRLVTRSGVDHQVNTALEDQVLQSVKPGQLVFTESAIQWSGARSVDENEDEEGEQQDEEEEKQPVFRRRPFPPRDHPQPRPGAGHVEHGRHQPRLLPHRPRQPGGLQILPDLPRRGDAAQRHSDSDGGQPAFQGERIHHGGPGAFFGFRSRPGKKKSKYTHLRGNKIADNPPEGPAAAPLPGEALDRKLG
ncbi:MAG: hypothetical protein BJ554DRAFT_7612 [Olpidium bornovanus]|uniref:Uncharacterized protein n=1 Tax=Olpidium bornovanus TaxID=278681 RepID=A0A8H7ZVS9_9FUNG|nr:MAG: hypothetical protein BJ554DRAFT_7612 [Olpidium bornovanus]